MSGQVVSVELYCIAGYFRGANILRFAVVVNFAEYMFVRGSLQWLVSNTTAGYVPDVII